MAEDKLSIDERLKIIRMQQTAHRQASKAEKGRILDTLMSVTQLERKTIIRHLNGSCERQPRRQQRGRKHGPEVDDSLRLIGERFDYLSEAECSEVPMTAPPMPRRGHASAFSSRH